MLTCLLILAVTLFLLTLYSILQTNAKVFHLESSGFLSIKILDTASAASLFVTVLGALLVRHQFAVGVLPRINYISTKTYRRCTENLDKSCETWRVEICNTGLGPAIITRAEYMLEHTDVVNSSDFYTFDDIIKEFVRIDLVRNHDYWLENITNGYSLSPKDNFSVFETKMEHIEKLKRLDLVLYFQGQLGDRYRREINLIPRL